MKTTDGSAEIPVGVRLGIVIRSAWVQATLNNRNMQGLGALFCLSPLARWLKLDREAWSRFVGRHSGTFNSNPFISPLGIGAIARVEADYMRGSGDGSAGDDEIGSFSAKLSTPLGAVGDVLFWASIRPQMVLLGLACCLIAGPWWGAAVLVAGFSAWQWSFRWLTFGWGWDLGTRVAAMLRDERMRRPGGIAAKVAAFLAGGIALGLMPWGYESLTGRTLTDLSVVVFVVAAIIGGVVAHSRRAETLALVGGLTCGTVAGFVASVARL